jgi:hypothetical protein
MSLKLDASGNLVSNDRGGEQRLHLCRIRITWAPRMATCNVSVAYLLLETLKP